MTKQSDFLKGAVAATGMALLILDSKTALLGAKKGLELCIQTVIPSLFPFFILSILLTGVMMGRTMRILHPLSRLFQIPKGAEMLLVCGMLGGYPVGAQCISQAYEQGYLNHQDARRMIAFCSNCGPAFLFGMIGGIFDEIWIPWALWAIHLISAWITSLVLPAGNPRGVSIKNDISLTVQQALNKALRIMASVCGWVIVFRIAIEFLHSWFLWMLPIEVQVAVCGILELSNGCIELRHIEDIGLRFMMCAGFLGFGGLCVTMQTYSVISAKLDHGLYFPGKLLQCCVSLLLASLVAAILPSGEKNAAFMVLPCLLGLGCAIILRKIQKNSSIRTVVRV